MSKAVFDNRLSTLSFTVDFRQARAGVILSNLTFSESFIAEMTVLALDVGIVPNSEFSTAQSLGLFGLSRPCEAKSGAVYLLEPIEVGL